MQAPKPRKGLVRNLWINSSQKVCPLPSVKKLKILDTTSVLPGNIPFPHHHYYQNHLLCLCRCLQSESSATIAQTMQLKLLEYMTMTDIQMYTGFHAPTLQHCSALHIAERTYVRRTPFLAQAAPPESDTRELQQKVCKAVGWAGCKLELVGNRWSLPPDAAEKVRLLPRHHPHSLHCRWLLLWQRFRHQGRFRPLQMPSFPTSYIVIFSWNFDSMGC